MSDDEATTATTATTSASQEASPDVSPRFHSYEQMLAACHAGEVSIEDLIYEAPVPIAEKSPAAIACYLLNDGAREPDAGFRVKNGPCGAVWSSHDLIVKCLTCQYDKTCAICVDCFDESLHEGHEWRFINSGGGICDCGDPEAWAAEGTCAKHRAGNDDVDPKDTIPAPLAQRCQAVVAGVMRVVQKHCDDEELDVETLGTRMRPLLRFLGSVAALGSATMRIVAEGLCLGIDTADYKATPHYAIVTRAHHFASQPHMNESKLVSDLADFYSKVITDMFMKKMVATQYVRDLPLMAANRPGWLASLSIQFLPAPQTVALLVAPRPEVGLPHGLFQALTEAIMVSLRASVQPIPMYSGIRRNIAGVETSERLRRQIGLPMIQSCIHDIEYCLQAPGMPWMFISNSGMFNKVLIYMLMVQQAFSSHRRDSDETSLQDMLEHEMKLMAIMPQLGEGLKDRTKDWDARVAVLASVASFIEVFLSHTLVHRDVDAKMSWLHENDMYAKESHGIFFQLPLHRLLASMVSTLAKDADAKSLRAALPDKVKEEFHNYAEHVMTIFTVRSQVAAGMWRRNHMGIEINVQYHAFAPLLRYYNKDYFLMQVYAAFSPTSMVAHLAHRHSSHQKLLPDTVDEKSNREHNVLEHLLRLILTLATDRTCMQDVVLTFRRRVIHALTQGPQKNSQLMMEASLTDVDDDDDGDDDEGRAVNGVIAECADRSQTADGTVEFRLKKEMWSEVNPYQLEWTRGQETADAHYASVFPKTRTLIPCNVTATPPKALRPVVGIVCNEVSVSLAVGTVRAAANKLVTEACLRYALDILILALRLAEEYRSCWPQVYNAENMFYNCRRESEGVVELVGNVTWDKELSPDAPVDIAKVLITPTEDGSTPLSHFFALLQLDKAKELHPAVRDLVELIRSSGDEAAAAVEASGAKVEAKDLTKKTVARKAKGQARQKDLLKKMHSKAKGLDFDLPDSEEDEADTAKQAANAATSLHQEMDCGWMDEESCSLCNMARSPHDSTDIGMIALVVKGRGLSGCFKPLDADPSAKRVRYGARCANETWETSHDADNLQIVHTCGHFVHLDCLESNVKTMMTQFNMYRTALAHPAAAEDVRRGFACLNIDRSEFLCPLCGRIANLVIPILSPEADDKKKAHQWDFPAVMTSLPTEEENGRDDSEVEEFFRSLDSESDVLEPMVGHDDATFMHHLCKYSEEVARILMDDGFLRSEDAAVGFAQQMVVAEIATRTAEDAPKVITPKKLVSLRTQLKAILANLHTCEADLTPLHLLLGPLEEDAETTDAVLLSRDIFGIWVQATLNVALRVDECGHAGYRYLMRRAIEAHLTKKVLELVAAKYVIEADEVAELVKHVTSHLPRNLRLIKPTAEPPVDVVQYLTKEMAVFMSWMAVLHCTITCPLSAQELVLPSFTDPAALEKLSAMLGFGADYASVESTAGEVVGRADADVGGSDAWLEHASGSMSLVREPKTGHHLPSLIELPKDYFELMNRYRKQVAVCGNVPSDPALCLSCGEIVCCGHSCPCAGTGGRGKGPCWKHALQCGSGQSLFLRIRKTMLIAVDNPRVCRQLFSPYVDAHGEEDPEFARGKPLFLNQTKLAKAAKIHAFGSYSFETTVVENSVMYDRAAGKHQY